MKNTLFILTLITIISSCKNEEALVDNINVEEAFEKHVAAFIEEGSKRGHEIDFEDTGLSILFGNIPNASASCSEIAGHDEGSHQIIVNKNAWETLNDSLQERLIFHELGHCELNRVHRNEKFDDGSWKSIMRGDPLTAIDELLPIPYFGFRKSYYLDELFEEQTQLPDWANLSFEYDELPEGSKNELLSYNNLESLNDTINLDLDNYELEFEIKTISGDDETWVAWGTEEKHYFFWFKNNQFHFSANSNYQGPFHAITDESFNANQLQKVTVRQDGPFCKIFLNEEFFFMVDQLPNDLFFIMSSSENEIEIESYTLSEIL